MHIYDRRQSWHHLVPEGIAKLLQSGLFMYQAMEEFAGWSFWDSLLFYK